MKQRVTLISFLLISLMGTFFTLKNSYYSLLPKLHKLLLMKTGDTTEVVASVDIKGKKEIHLHLELGLTNNNFGGVFTHFNEEELLDISSFDSLYFNIDSFTTPYILIYLGYLTESNDTLLTELDIALTKEKKRYAVSIESLPIPQWGTKEIRGNAIPYERALCIGFGTAKTPSILPKTKIFYNINRVGFSKSRSKTYLHVLLWNIPLFLLLMTLFIMKRQKQFKFINNAYNINEIEKLLGENCFIEKCNPASIAKQLDIDAETIELFCQKKYKHSFSQYISLIRLTEADRLLQESDLLVKEIAHRIGYKQVTTFNKEYKMRRGISPTESRELGRKK